MVAILVVVEHMGQEMVLKARLVGQDITVTLILRLVREVQEVVQKVLLVIQDIWVLLIVRVEHTVTQVEEVLLAYLIQEIYIMHMAQVQTGQAPNSREYF